MASADLVVNIVTKMAGDGMAQAEKSTSRFKSGLATASKFAGAALLGVGAAAIHAANAAAEDQKSQDLLATSMRNAAGASKDQIAQTESWIDAQSRATGVADDELRPALGTLVRATGDVAKSQKALQVAMDVSAATGKPLQSVTDAMAKGFAGNTSALSRLVPGISQAALKSGNFARVMKEVGDATQGSAAAAAESAAGKMQRFKVALGETQEAAGAALLPVLDKLSGLLVTVGQWAQDHGTMFTVIAAGVAVLAAAIVTLNLAVTIYTAVTTLAASATLMAWAAALGPILLVIAAVLLVVGAVVLLWKKSETFRAIVTGVWNAIKAGAQAVASFIVSAWDRVKSGVTAAFDFIKAHWAILLVALTGPLGIAIALIIKNWGKIKQVVRTVFNSIKNVAKGVLDFLKTRVQNVKNNWVNAWQFIRDKVRAVFDAIKDKARALVDFLRQRVDSVKNTWTNAWNGMRDKAKAAFDAVKAKVSAIMSSIKTTISNAVSSVKSKLGEIGDKIKGLVPSGLASTLSKPFNTMKTAVDGVVGAVKDLVGWIKDIPVPHIDWPSPPKWVDKIIPGMAMVPAPESPGVAAARAAAPGVPVGRVGGLGMGATGAGPTINIYGAVDPEATARQIQRLLSGHNRRVGIQVA